MKIVVTELKQVHGQRRQLNGEINVEGLKIPQLTFDEFAFDGQAGIDGDLVVVQGEISGSVHTECARCAQPTSYRFQAPFEEQFSDGPIVDEEESETIPFQSGKIELTPYFEQTIVLEMPQVLLCSEACKGLCPSCGTNWNERSCSCDNERIDPRLADLALFFKKDEKN